MTRALGIAGAAALAAALLLAPLGAQQQTPPPGPQTPILRASVDQVIVDAVVTDENGGVVPALTAEDFEVFERGQRQAIGTFSEVSLPLVRPLKATAPVAASDVRTNQRRPEGRIYVLVLDDHHVGVGRTGTVQNAAREFLNRQVQSGDLVAVVTTTGVGGAFQDFTEDALLASAAVDRFVGRQAGETAALQKTAEDAFMARAAQNQASQAQAQAAAQVGADLSVSQAATNQAESAFGARNADPMAVRRNSTAIIADGAITDNDDAAVEAMERARITLRTLRTIADGLGGIPGRRKAILYFSEGLPVTPRAADLVAELTRVTAAAARANVTIYTFDPRGLDLHMGAELLATGVSPSAQLQQKRRLSAEMLRTLSEETGGAAALETNALGGALERVASESSHYYLLGYTPTDPAHDGRYRSIEVRVKRPDAQIYFINFSTARRGGLLHPFSGFTLSVSQTQVESRGSIHIASPDPHVQPAIRYNYLSTENDRRVMVDGLKLIRRIAATAPLHDYVANEEFPGARVQSDAELLAFCREAGDTVFHPTSTCRMGADARAVVDVRLRVQGVEQLRVVDASVMPAVPSGNINATVLAVAEKAADIVRASS